MKDSEGVDRAAGGKLSMTWSQLKTWLQQKLYAELVVH